MDDDLSRSLDAPPGSLWTNMYLDFVNQRDTQNLHPARNP